jgi:hypothetical protein
MLNGTIKVAVVLSYVRLLGARAPGAGDQRTLATATTAPTRVMRAAAAQPGGHGRSLARLAYRAGGPRFDDLMCLDHCGQVHDGNRHSQAAMLADHHHGQDRDNNLPDKQRPPVPQHLLPPVGFVVVSWHVGPVHAVRAALV